MKKRKEGAKKAMPFPHAKPYHPPQGGRIERRETFGLQLIHQALFLHRLGQLKTEQGRPWGKIQFFPFLKLLSPKDIPADLQSPQPRKENVPALNDNKTLRRSFSPPAGFPNHLEGLEARIVKRTTSLAVRVYPGNTPDWEYVAKLQCIASAHHESSAAHLLQKCT
jgi:hypothetical protein